MKLIKIYQCLCDRTRLRILNLLSSGSLCVCHFQDVLGEPQVKVSKHLAYLRARGLVSARRRANWMIYSLPKARSKELASNLACLQDCAREDPLFKADRVRLEALRETFTETGPACCNRSIRAAKPIRRAAP